MRKKILSFNVERGEIMFEYKITLNDNDYIQFNKYHLLNSPSGKKSLWIYRLFIPIICLMVVIIFAIAGSDSLLV